MKKFLATVLFSSLSYGVSAGEGILPYWAMTASETSCISISNISNAAVKIKVTLFNQNGAEYAGAIDFGSNISSLGQDTLLAPKKSADFCLRRSAGDLFGHGVIKTREVEGAVGKSFVVAHARQVYVAGGFHSAAVPINNGLPF